MIYAQPKLGWVINCISLSFYIYRIGNVPVVTIFSSSIDIKIFLLICFFRGFMSKSYWITPLIKSQIIQSFLEYIYIYIYIYIWERVRKVYMSEIGNVRMCVWVYVYVCVCVCMCVSVYFRVYVWVRMRVNSHFAFYICELLLCERRIAKFLVNSLNREID